MKYLLKAVLLAFAYYISGRLGLLLAAPPAYATAIWPPAGLALAFILIFGRRYWPGVLLGSLAINLLTAGEGGNAPGFLASGGIALILACGASLQAEISARICQGKLSNAGTLETLPEVVWLLVLGGPFGCMINATVGTVTLILFGLVSAQAGGATWLTWWTADTMGVLVFTPILLLQFNRKAAVSTLRKLAVCVALVTAFTLAVILFLAARNSETERERDIFEKQAEGAASYLNTTLFDYRDSIYSLALLFDTTPQVTRGEFGAFARGMMQRHTGMTALSWIPRVPQSERADYEDAQRKEGFPEFTIVERDAASNNFTAAIRALYYPVTFIEPYIPKAHGFDISSEPVRRLTLERAQDSGIAQASPRINIVLDGKSSYGTVIVRPVYRKGAASDTVEARRKNLQGFVAGGFMFPEVVAASFKGISDMGFDLLITDDSTDSKNPLLYDSRTPDHKESRVPLPFGLSDQQWQQTIDVAGRSWTVHCVQTQAQQTIKQSWTVWFVLLGGLVFTGLLEVFVLLVTARADIVQRLVEEKTREQSKLTSIIEESADFIGIADLDGNLLYHNRAARRMAGYPPDYDMKGMNISDMHPAWALEKIRKEGLPTALSDGYWQGETALMHVSGYEIQVLQNITILKDGQGNPVCSTTIMRDISERKEGEEKMRAAEALKQVMLDSSLYSIIAVGTDGIIHTFNRTAERMLGYTAEEMIGKATPEILHDKDEIARAARALTQEFRQQILPGMGVFTFKSSMGRTDEGEWTYIRRNGSRFPVFLSITALRDDKRIVTGYMGIARDISIDKENEQQRQKAEEKVQELVSQLTESNTELERFAYVASHDMQEPLRMIVNFGALLAGEYAEKLDEEGRQYVDMMTQSAIRMQDMVNDLLEYARIGNDTVPFSTVDAEQEIKKVLDNLTAAISDRSAVVHHEPLPKVKANPIQFVRLLQNLIGNGLKYQRDNIPEVHVAAEEKGDFWEFSVRDNGIGMAEEYVKRIFEPFVRLHTWHQYKGTGIGLAVCQKIVENHGGRIWVTSEVGKGSVFYFTLPKA